MKKNRFKALPLLLVLPALMANSGIPTVSYKNYKDYELTYANKKELASLDVYHYSFNLNNKGQGYIAHLSVSNNDYSTDDSYFYANLLFYDMFSPFRSAVIPPSFTGEVVLESRKNNDEFDKMFIRCEAYNNFDPNLTVEGTKKVTPYHNDYASEEYSIYYYDVDINIKYPENSTYDYGAILKTTYLDNVYYIKVDSYQQYRISSSTPLDLAHLTISDVVVIKEKKQFAGLASAIAIIVTIFVVGFFLLISFGIFAIIFFPAMARRRRRNRNKLNQK